MRTLQINTRGIPQRRIVHASFLWSRSNGFMTMQTAANNNGGILSNSGWLRSVVVSTTSKLLEYFCCFVSSRISAEMFAIAGLPVIIVMLCFLDSSNCVWHIIMKSGGLRVVALRAELIAKTLSRSQLGVTMVEFPDTKIQSLMTV